MCCVKSTALLNFGPELIFRMNLKSQSPISSAILSLAYVYRLVLSESSWRKKTHQALTTPDRCYCLNQASLTMFMAGLERRKTKRSQTATDVVMVIKQSPGSWSHVWSLNNVSGCGSTSLFGSCAGTHQGKGSVSRFGR